MNEQLIQYDTCDIALDACKRIAAELRASGIYSIVQIRKRPSERGREFGKIFVKRKEPTA